MNDSETAPSGESERPVSELVARLVETRDEVSDLRAEAARLTAENERLERWKEIVTAAPETAERLADAERIRPIVAVWRDRLQAAEAEAARYREALEHVKALAAPPLYGHNLAIAGVIADEALTAEGGDRAN